MTLRQQTALNILSALGVFTINLAIQFFLTRFLVAKLGIEASGFYNLGCNLISYLSVVTIALNSMAGRFVAFEYHSGHHEAAKRFYSSLWAGNWALVLALTLIVTPVICYLQRIITIPDRLIADVKTLFALLCVNFFITTLLSAWLIICFVNNQVYWQSLHHMLVWTMKGAVLWLLLRLLPPQIFYVGAALLLATLLGCVLLLWLRRNFLRDIVFSWEHVRVAAIKQLCVSGAWNSLNYAGILFTNGMDILLANVLFTPRAMGLVAAAKVLPTVVVALCGNLFALWGPRLTKLYAENRLQEFKNYVKFANSVFIFFLSLPLGIILVFGEKFFALWLPGEASRVLYLLAAITCAPLVITSGIQCCNIVFTVTNHLRTNSLLVLGTGLLNIICVIAGKKLFDLDFFSVVIFSGAGILLRNLFYTAPRTATLTGFPCFTYFGGIVKSVVCVGVTILAGAVFIRCIPAESWPSLAADVLLTSLFAAAANVFILFSMRQIHDFASASWRRLHFAHNN